MDCFSPLRTVSKFYCAALLPVKTVMGGRVLGLVYYGPLS